MDILPYEGRVGRGRFALGAVFCWLFLFAGLFGVLTAMTLLSPEFVDYLAKSHTEFWRPPPMPWAVSVALACVSGLALLLAPCSWISLCIGRLHDLDCPGWTVLVALFVVWACPHDTGAWVVNGAFMLIPGTAGPNRYGADPCASGVAVS